MTSLDECVRNVDGAVGFCHGTVSMDIEWIASMTSVANEKDTPEFIIERLWIFGDKLAMISVIILYTCRDTQNHNSDNKLPVGSDM